MTDRDPRQPGRGGTTAFPETVNDLGVREETAIEREMDVDSPRFMPAALADFEVRGFVRRHRWGK